MAAIAPLDVDVLLARPPRSLEGLPADRWRALLDGAHRHGALQAIAGRLPDDGALRLAFDRLVAVARARDAALRRSLDAALAALGARGVDACALKGPVLADRVYPDPALRPAGDLDLLVARDRLDDAVTVLAEIGYRRAAPRGRWRAHPHHLTLVHPDASAIELHFQPQTGFGARLRAEEVLARARRHATAGGAAVHVLAPEDEVVYLALHAAGHLLERRGWLLDLLLWMDAHPRIDWSTVAERARRARGRRALSFVFRQLDALGARVPGALLRDTGPRRARAAERLRREALARPARSAVRQGAKIVFEASMCDNVLLSARHVADKVQWFARRNVHRAAHRLRPSN